MNRRGVAALVALVLGWSLGACSGEENGDRADSSAGTGGAQTQPRTGRRQPAGPPPVSDETEIRLIDPGQEPRAPIAYSFEPGQKETMIADIELRGSFGGKEETAFPIMRVRVDLAVALHEQPDRYRLLMTVGDIDVVSSSGVDSAMVENARRAFENWPTLNGVVIVGSNGASHGFDLQVPADAPDVIRQTADNVKQSLRQILLVFPEEPIGEGARWAAVTSASFQGMSFSQVETFTLQGHEGDALRLAATQEMSNERTQRLSPNVDLLELSAKGAGTYRVELDRLVPESEMQVRWTMTTEKNGEKTEDVVSTQISTYRE